MTNSTATPTTGEYMAAGMSRSDAEAMVKADAAACSAAEYARAHGWRIWDKPLRNQATENRLVASGWRPILYRENLGGLVLAILGVWVLPDADTRAALDGGRIVKTETPTGVKP